MSQENVPEGKIYQRFKPCARLSKNLLTSLTPCTSTKDIIRALVLQQLPQTVNSKQQNLGDAHTRTHTRTHPPCTYEMPEIVDYCTNTFTDCRAWIRIKYESTLQSCSILLGLDNTLHSGALHGERAGTQPVSWFQTQQTPTCPSTLFKMQKKKIPLTDKVKRRTFTWNRRSQRACHTRRRILGKTEPGAVRSSPSDRCAWDRHFHPGLSQKESIRWSACTHDRTNNWLCSVSGFPLTTVGGMRRCAMTHGAVPQLLWSLQRWMPRPSVVVVSAVCHTASALCADGAKRMKVLFFCLLSSQETITSRGIHLFQSSSFTSNVSWWNNNVII